MDVTRRMGLVFATLSGLTSARRFRRGKDSEFVQVLHPGHAAVSITRLLRHDHGGMAALLESERVWESGSASLVQEAESADTLPGWTMSTEQFQWLQQHQQAELMENSSHSLLEASGEERDEEPSALRLSSLSSEYVGPVGVGSVFSDPACASMAEGSSASHGAKLAELKQQGCKVQAQSHIWVVFDTGSTNIWINSDACKKGSCAHKDRHRYDHIKSHSYKEPRHPSVLSVKFGTGAMEGPMALDDFSIGPVNVHGQSFAMIKEQRGSVFESIPLEGIVGLAFPAMAADDSTPFLENVVMQHALPSNEVSFYFSAANPSANAMLWGGVDSKFHDGPIEYFNVNWPFYWGLEPKQGSKFCF